MGRPIFHDSYEHWQSAATVRRSHAFVYDLWQGRKDYTNRIAPKHNKNLGTITKKQKGRIQKYVELLFDAAKMKRVWYNDEKKYFFYKIGFITLTLPSKQIHPDNEIYRECLKPFLRKISKHRMDFLYIWKAECQDNGNIHFHITTNSFLHYDYVRDIWNKCVNRLGYVDRCNQSNPPSSDIRAVKNDKTLAIYMAKYLSKKESYKKSISLTCPPAFDHYNHCGVYVCDVNNRLLYEMKRTPVMKLWDCSSELKAIKTSSLLDFEQEMELMANHRSLLDAEGENLYIYRFDSAGRKAIPNVMRVYYNAVIQLRGTTHRETAVYKLPDNSANKTYHPQLN